MFTKLLSKEIRAGVIKLYQCCHRGQATIEIFIVLQTKMRLARLLLSPTSRKFAEKLDHYGFFHPQSISLQRYLDFGKDGTAEISYKFLQKELLVRLANIMKVRLINRLVRERKKSCIS